MKSHIIVQGSSLKYAELPPKRSIHNPDKPTKEYQEALESAIEIHPDSTDFTNYKVLKDGVYPIEAKVRIEMLWNTETQDWQEVAFIEPIEKHMPVGDTMQDQMMTVLHSLGLNPIKTSKKVMTDKEEAKDKRQKMTRESWIRNVMRIYPQKTRKETEELYDKIFNKKELNP